MMNGACSWSYVVSTSFGLFLCELQQKGGVLPKKILYMLKKRYIIFGEIIIRRYDKCHM